MSNNDAQQVRRVQLLLGHLLRALTSASLYAPDHPQVLAAIPGILDPLQRYLAHRSELSLIFTREDILFAGKPLERNPQIRRIARIFADLEIGHIRFLPGVEAADLRQLIRCAAGQEDLAALKVPGSRVQVGSVEVPPTEEQEAQIASFEDLSPEQLDDLQALFGAIGAQDKIDVHNLVSIVKGFVTAFQREANPLLALAPLRRFDDYTFTHSINVGILNMAQGMSLGIDGQLLHDLGIAGMLHDAGKLFVDRKILNRPGKLTEEEWIIMRSHPSTGAQYLMNQEGIPTLAVIAAFEHHMRYNLQGYPPTPPGWRLNLASQMTMISDTFDALRTRRVYKDPWDFAKASGLMLEIAGTQLNPDLTMNFLKLLARLGEKLPPMAADEDVPARECYCE
ncbi:MAG: HD domain-containing phosphohydrolase [Desulfuromonadales bacterium]